MRKVTMNLTERDIEITDKLTAKLHARSKASTVSSALSVMNELTDMVDDGGVLFSRKKDGSVERLVITGLRGV